jgi:hypothetical protein
MTSWLFELRRYYDQTPRPICNNCVKGALEVDEKMRQFLDERMREFLNDDNFNKDAP